MLKKLDFVWWLGKMFGRTLVLGLKHKKFKVEIKAEAMKN